MTETASGNTTMKGESLNISEQRKQQLKQLFPGVFTETKNDAGELLDSIDFERLKAELGEFSEIYDNRRERYGMDWPGKRDCLRLIQATSQATLKPCREESVDFDTTQNLFIEGDNLEVLKLLQKSYYGQVKMIYIDPPYNTGKEFIYPDNFSESLDTYLQYAGLKDNDGRKFSTNSANEGRFHTKWLNMMYPRLYLARNLLKEDGVIFISIDDGEQTNLRKVCEDVFGEENFVANVIWQKKYTRANDAKWFSDNHDHVLCYAKNENSFVLNELPRTEVQLKAYKNPDDHPKGLWKATPLHAKSGTNTESFTFRNGVIWSPPTGTYRRFNDASMKEMDENNEIWFGVNGLKIPSRKSFLDKIKGGVTPVTIWTYDEVGHNHEASTELKDIGIGGMFDNPKPTRLIRRMINLTESDQKDDTVLDFFAGSATTAHAVMQLNLEDGGRRKCISVQLPEPGDEKTEAYKAGYKNIAEISKERIRRAAKKIQEELSGQLDLEGKADLDLGFKVLKLNQSNFKQWQAPPKDIEDEALLKQIELNVDHIDPNTSSEDLLYELLIKAGIMPTEKIEAIILAGHSLFSVADDLLLIHLECAIDQALIYAVLAKAPQQFICLDKAFHSNDQLKANAVKTFDVFNQGKEKIDQIDFKTV